MKATVVSLLPFQLNELKPGLIPDTFIVPPSDGKVPGVLVIPDNIECPIYRGGEMPPFRSPIRAEDLAADIVGCYINSQWGTNSEAYPALFWVPGEFTGSEVLLRFKSKIDEVKAAHNKWCITLVRLADDDWNRNHRHKTISDLQRYAARTLGLVNKEWYASPTPEKLVECPSCTSLIPERAKKCKVCGEFVTQPELAKAK